MKTPPARVNNKKRAERKINTIVINDNYQAVYEISNFGWVLKKKNKDGEFENLCYPSNLKSCIKTMIEFEVSSKCKTLKKVLEKITELESSIDEALKIRLQ